MKAASRHITWEGFRQQIESGVPARFAVGEKADVWLSFQGHRLALITARGKATSAPASPLRQVKIALGRERSGPTLEISTERPDLYREFFFLALGIADMIQQQARPPAEAFAAALDSWKELLRSTVKLSEEQQVGLAGELWLLLRLVRQGGAGAVDAWTGPRGEPHDFRTARNEFEVKSTRSATRTHVIHGLGQLVPSDKCKLFLVSLQWEPAGTADGSTLTELVESVRAELRGNAVQLTSFNVLLRDRLHFLDEDGHLYTEKLRMRTTPRLIAVDASFPKITREHVEVAAGAAAPRISEVTYRVNVEGLGVDEMTAAFRKILP